MCVLRGFFLFRVHFFITLLFFYVKGKQEKISLELENNLKNKMEKDKK